MVDYKSKNIIFKNLLAFIFVLTFTLLTSAISVENYILFLTLKLIFSAGVNIFNSAQGLSLRRFFSN